MEFIKEFTGYDDLSIYSNRTPEQIVTNFINKYDSNYVGELNISNLDIILEFLSLDGDLQSTLENLHKFQNKYKIDISKGIIDFEDTDADGDGNLDSDIDSDGVYNYRDQCPDTPEGLSLIHI